MKTQARVVVIGGGVVGVSTLYHLARKGWSDVVLVERKELTSGSTWHAAGLLPLFNMSYSVGQIHKYSVAFYKELEAGNRQNVGFSVCSNIRLARTKDRWDEYMYYAGVRDHRVKVNVLTPQQLKEIWPLCETDGILGAIQHPDDGYIQPADLTQALAKGARSRGAEIYRNTAVIGIERQPNGEWLSPDRRGRHRLRARRRRDRQFRAPHCRMVGLDIRSFRWSTSTLSPSRTRPSRSAAARGCPKWACCGKRLLLVHARGSRRAAARALREGRPGLLCGRPVEDSEYELFQEDLERLMPHIETAIARVPAFGEVGHQEGL
jgi:dimethylglycine dehydrogenase